MTTNAPSKKAYLFAALLLSGILQSAFSATTEKPAQPGSFSMEQILGYPYPLELTASPTGSRIAWVFNERGVRNIWVAEGPGFRARQVTDYKNDDGQELTNLSFSHDGGYIAYVRGGDHDSNYPAAGNLQPDPASSATQPKLEVMVVPFSGGAPKLLAEGDAPLISPRGDRVLFLRDHQVWWAPLDGSKPAARAFFCRGESASPQWSPDGNAIAFVSNREDHAFIAVYRSDAQPVQYLAPTTSVDSEPVWSPDGSRIAFIREPGRGGAPQTILDSHPQPWAIWVADARTGDAHEVWKSPNTLLGSRPQTQGGPNLHWGAGNRLVFLSDLDGWPHVYSVAESGGQQPLLLTPGNFMDEFVTMSPDGGYVVYNANAGPDGDDIERRHLFRVPVNSASPSAITAGKGIEWTPLVTGDGATVAFIQAGAQKAPMPAVVPVQGGESRILAEDRVPADFPTAQLIVPKKIVVKAEDGLEVHCQLFERADLPGKKPAVIFVHGGPPRQMMLGWHYMEYYSNAYAVNQYLASHGYVVLSVNYRLGIGYGHAFHHPEHSGFKGAAEYKDVLAGARFLQTYNTVDAKRIGIWGGSYGGFLTALALARNSDIFAAGVDLHGVHDWSTFVKPAVADSMSRVEKDDAGRALQVAWESSPISSVSKWRSPVLLIHGDDDRNVRFHQTVDLARRLDAVGVRYEEMMIPDEIHGFLRHQTWAQVDAAIAKYLDKVFAMQ